MLNVNWREPPIGNQLAIRFQRASKYWLFLFMSSFFSEYFSLVCGQQHSSLFFPMILNYLSTKKTRFFAKKFFYVAVKIIANNSL
jgi:hypothetical protein